LSCYDIRQRRLPNRLTLPGAAVILLAAAVAGRGLPALAGAATLAGVYLLVHLVAPAGMGAGDVKLAIGVGGLAGCFGAEVWLLAALSAPLLTALCAAGMRVARFLGGAAGTVTVPHGPSMCVATAGAAGLALLG
jgi:leader peptidase (prepilin peptidase)/N-methyltransferase